MQIFLDTGDIELVNKYYDMGVVTGVTTNPLLVAKHKIDRMDFIKELMKFELESVSVEMITEKADEMLKEAEAFLDLGESITIKLPMTAEGLKACKALSSNEIKVNMTLCFSVYQAILAAEAGAFCVSPFIGRAEDNGIDGKELLEDIYRAYFQSGVQTRILAASIRNLDHIKMAALVGADFATMPPNLIDEMLAHELTDAGQKQFLEAARGMVGDAQE